MRSDPTPPEVLAAVFDTQHARGEEPYGAMFRGMQQMLCTPNQAKESRDG